MSILVAGLAVGLAGTPSLAGKVAVENNALKRAPVP
ncbi:hypothetical protein [Ewingella americana]